MRTFGLSHQIKGPTTVKLAFLQLIQLEPVLATFTVVGPLIWCDNPKVRMSKILYINNNNFHHLGRPQMCAGAWCLFGISKSHSERLWHRFQDIHIAPTATAGSEKLTTQTEYIPALYRCWEPVSTEKSNRKIGPFSISSFLLVFWAWLQAWSQWSPDPKYKQKWWSGKRPNFSIWFLCGNWFLTPTEGRDVLSLCGQFFLTGSGCRSDVWWALRFLKLMHPGLRNWRKREGLKDYCANCMFLKYLLNRCGVNKTCVDVNNK